jgi:hypothetical protein
MNFILTSQTFFSFVKSLPSTLFTDDKTQSFKSCFSFFNYQEYFISNKDHKILLELKLIDPFVVKKSIKI